MMTSTSVSTHDLDLINDHPFAGIQLVTTPTDHGHCYYHNWLSDHHYHHHHHHHQLDQLNKEQVGSDHHDGLINHAMDGELQGIESWTWEQNDHDDDLYVPGVRSVDIDSEDMYDNWVPNSSKLKVVKKMNPKRASNSNTKLEIAIDDDFHYSLQADHNDSISNGNSNTNVIRVCSDCNTTKTPLWRSGPKGPKSLCNACGIRQRKARRALAAAAVATCSSSDNNTLAKSTTSKSLKTKKNSTTCDHEDNTHETWQQPYKKRLKHVDHYDHHHSTFISASQDSNLSSGGDDNRSGERKNNERICFEEFMASSLSKNASIHRVFPQDEKEAAILLMALSCGLVHNHN